MGLYKRGKNWSIDFFYQNKRHREAIGPNKGLASDVLAQRKVEIRENRFFPNKQKEPDPVKFHDFAKEYLQWAKANKKPSTYLRDLYTMRIFDKEFGRKKIQDITTRQIERYKAKRKEKWKAATVNRELALLKHIFSKAVEWKILGENPANRTVKFLKGAVNRVRFLMPDEFQKLLSNCDDFLKPIVIVAVHTGLRRGELLNLMWNHVSFDQRIITILDTKNSERKDIPMDETVRITLQGLERRGEFVFPNKRGKPFNSMIIHYAFHGALDRSEITDFRFHDLRHTFASNLVMAGVKIEKVQILMGHKMISMTQRYAHLAPGYLAESVKVLDRIMNPVTQKKSQGNVIELKPLKERGFSRENTA
ncbi:MAG: tyrosine-type recombinase/integrase [Thermodesulfobacteriota bacterium]|jgi:integrase